MREGLPIIYVRGFAGGTAGINAAVDDPFYGFNSGSTHVRVGSKREPRFYQFESPLMRLMLDHGYTPYGGGLGGQRSWLEAQPNASVGSRSIWIHRFYDVSASTWGARPQEFRIENAAADLLAMIQLVRAKTTGTPRVHLVAHSMGGLVCRCLIQKIIPEARATDPSVPPAEDLVASLFTYATPHGGIQFDIGMGVLERLRDALGIEGADIFGPARMWQYLTPTYWPEDPPPGWQPREMPDGAFPKDRIFTLVGTNPGDYDAAGGLSSKVVGARSDGLVQIDNASVPGAGRAFVHRSHSGRFGIVNSEEGYQNLRRFLFGDLEVRGDLVGLELPADPADLVWQAEVELTVRGLPVLLHERVADHECPIELLPGQGPVPLGMTYLFTDTAERPDEARFLRYTVHLRILSLAEDRGFFDFTDHLEKSADFDDHLIIDIDPTTTPPAGWARWASEIPTTLRDYQPDGSPLPDTNQAPGVWEHTVPLPEAARFLGSQVGIQLTARARPPLTATAQPTT
jgi:pimeloyl-ACP methyl ester carboxylesterase